MSALSRLSELRIVAWCRLLAGALIAVFTRLKRLWDLAASRYRVAAARYRLATSKLARAATWTKLVALALASKLRIAKWYLFAAGALIGAFAWSGHLRTLPAVFALPLLFRLRVASQPFGLLSTVFGYFCGALWPIIPGASLFLGNSNFIPESLLLWLLYAALETLPYVLGLWRPGGTAAGFALAAVLSILSPIAILNPLTAAGACFPAWGLVGVLATAVLFALLPAYPRLAITTATVGTLIACALYEPPPPPSHWTAVDTLYGGSSFTMPGQPEYQKATSIRDAVDLSEDQVRLYPESTLIHWNVATDRFFTPLAGKLTRQNRTLILGADITHPGGLGYENALIVFGSDRGVYLQHLPMPYSMWNPYSKNSVPLHFGGPYTIQIHHLKAAPVICYEQLHPYPFLRASFDRPQVILAVANDYWARHTYIRHVQHSALEAWSRLFNTPYLSATNQ